MLIILPIQWFVINVTKENHNNHFMSLLSNTGKQFFRANTQKEEFVY